MTLKDRFYELLGNWTIDMDQISAQWQQLYKEYGATSRPYHNLGHLEEMFRYFDSYKEELLDANEVACAIFYHDIIYNIWSKNNELNSAELAKKFLLSIGLEPKKTDRIFGLIMATKNHVVEGNKDQSWMVDFDLGILGQSNESYKNYTQQIRKEYATVPNIMYKKGRKKVLQHFLDKESIYKTKAFQSKYESQARINLSNELITL